MLPSLSLFLFLSPLLSWSSLPLLLFLPQLLLLSLRLLLRRLLRRCGRRHWRSRKQFGGASSSPRLCWFTHTHTRTEALIQWDTETHARANLRNTHFLLSLFLLLFLFSFFYVLFCFALFFVASCLLLLLFYLFLFWLFLRAQKNSFAFDSLCQFVVVVADLIAICCC